MLIYTEVDETHRGSVSSQRGEIADRTWGTETSQDNHYQKSNRNKTKLKVMTQALTQEKEHEHVRLNLEQPKIDRTVNVSVWCCHELFPYFEGFLIF